jgi:hypothetical protein
VSKLRRRLLDRFGVDSLDALFYGAKWGLRFELGGDWDVAGGQIPRMLQAVDRARAVTEAAFAGSATVEAVINKWGHRRPGPRNLAFKRLAGMGFQPTPLYQGVHRDPDDEPTDPRAYYFLAGPVGISDGATLIWDACASAIGVAPASPMLSIDGADQFRSYLVDFERGILVDVYDDRGMDVIAVDCEALRPLHVRFSDWLLDYDRARMDAMFAD